jgi:hypothetical protein
MEAVAGSKCLPIILLIAEGFAALASSRNQGSMFLTPLLPSLLIVSTLGLFLVFDRRCFVWGVYFAVASACAATILPMVDLDWSLAKPLVATIPLLDRVTITDGRAPIQFYEKSAGYLTDNSAKPIDVETGRQWVQANIYSARKIYALSSGRSVTALGVRGYLYNANTLNFYWMFEGNAALPFIQATPEHHGNTVEA